MGCGAADLLFRLREVEVQGWPRGIVLLLAPLEGHSLGYWLCWLLQIRSCSSGSAEGICPWDIEGRELPQGYLLIAFPISVDWPRRRLDGAQLRNWFSVTSLGKRKEAESENVWLVIEQTYNVYPGSPDNAGVFARTGDLRFRR